MNIWRKFSYCFVIVLSITLLTSCSVAKSKDFVFHATVMATYGGRPIEGSAVLRQPMFRSPQGYTRGEAVILELGNGKRAYMLLMERQNLSRMYFGTVIEALNPIINPDDKPIGTKEKIARVLDAPVGTRSEWKFRKAKPNPHLQYYGYPLVVAFKNEADPASIFLVETEKPTQLFGKRFDFRTIHVERVASNTPLTNKLVEILPWVSPKHPYWEEMRLKGYSGHKLGGSTGQLLAQDANFSQRISRRYFVSADRR